MTDPTALDDVLVPDPSFMDDYDTGGTFTPPPQAKFVAPTGKLQYTKFVLTVPDVDKIRLKDNDGKWLKTKEGLLKIVIEGLKESLSGYEFRETTIGTGQFYKYVKGVKTTELRNASPAMDYLHAHGIDAKPGTAGEYETYFHYTANRNFEATIDWSSWDKDTQRDVASKYEDFPLAETLTGDDLATFQRWYPNADLKTARVPYIVKDGKRFWARAQMKRPISTVESK